LVKDKLRGVWVDEGDEAETPGFARMFVYHESAFHELAILTEVFSKYA